jgi:hypothetical protein
MLQLILIIVVSIVILILLLALIMEKETNIFSEIIINRSKSDVFNYVKLLKNQEKYSKWVMADPNVILIYKGTDGTVGFTSSWNSKLKNVGSGKQEITNIKEGERYEVEIRFKKPFKGVNHATTTTQAISDNQTRVVTTFNSKTPFPMNIMLPMIKKMLQKDMDETCANLKRVLEH